MTRGPKIKSGGMDRHGLEHVPFDRLRMVMKDTSHAVRVEDPPVEKPRIPFGRGPSNEEKASRQAAKRHRLFVAYGGKS